MRAVIFHTVAYMRMYFTCGRFYGKEVREMSKKTRTILFIVVAFFVGVALAGVERLTDVDLGIVPIMAGPIIVVVLGAATGSFSGEKK